ncbi:MAG: polysaccharide deacetylase family protein [Candidatus Bipolaricaulota bacterium]|nr:MAG: polysaccharide deacetylase family protein [Candidatus Bipolaricaulota bacterium]
MIRLLVDPAIDGPELRYAARQLLLLARLPHRILSYDVARREDREEGPVVSYGRRLPPLDLRTDLHVRAVPDPGESVRWPGPTGTGRPILHRGLPVLSAGSPAVDGHVARLEGRLETDLDLFASTFALLSRAEEIGAPERDRFGRFPASSSVATAHSFLSRPVVNEYADLFAGWVEPLGAEAARCPPWSQGFVFCVTHDIDQLALFSSLRQVAGAIRRIARGPRRTRRMLRLGVDGIAARRGRRSDPYDCFARLFELERDRGIAATYYVMAGGGGQHEGRYRLSDALPLLDALVRQGHEIGVHGSLKTWRDGERLAREVEAIARRIGGDVAGGRQHYLRLSVPETWRAAAAAGLRYDSTLGYPDAVGFRAGVCTPYRPFDPATRDATALWELPLAVMDATLHTVLRLTPDEAVRRTIDVARVVAEHHGLFVLLWHNTSMYDVLHPGWTGVLPRIVDELRALGGEPLRMMDAVERWERHVRALRCAEAHEVD